MAWRKLDQAEQDPMCQEYMKILEAEFKAKCLAVIEMVDEYLVDESLHNPDNYTEANLSNEEWKNGVEAQVFYLKLQGDYYRYLAEIFSDSEFPSKPQPKYDLALKIAKKVLNSTHPTRLGLVLNASVCTYEIVGDQKRATEMAQKGFDEAISQLDTLSDQSYKDSTLIMQLLRDNITLWTKDPTGENEDQELGLVLVGNRITKVRKQVLLR